MRERLRARNAVRMALAAGISAAARSGRQRAHGGEGRARSTLVLRQATVGQRHAGVRELPSAIARLQRGRRDSDRLDRPEASSQLHGARQRRVLGDVHLGAFRNQHDRAARPAAVVRRSAGGDGRRRARAGDPRSHPRRRHVPRAVRPRLSRRARAGHVRQRREGAVELRANAGLVRLAVRSLRVLRRGRCAHARRRCAA